MLLTWLCAAASATDYTVGNGGTYESLWTALEAAVAQYEDPFGGFSAPARFFILSPNVPQVNLSPIDLALPFDVEIDGQGTGYELAALELHSNFVLRKIHLAETGGTSISIDGASLTLDEVWAGNGGTEQAVVATNGATVTALGGTYSGHEQAFNVTDSTLVFGSTGAYGNTPLIQGNVSLDRLGGAVHGVSSTITIDGVFSGNQAQSGGAIWVEGGSTLTVLATSQIHDNHAITEGGAIGLRDSAITVDGGVYSWFNNWADTLGGFAYLENPTGTAQLTALTADGGGLQSAQKGGFVYFVGDVDSSLAITGGSYTNSSVTASGGFLYADGGLADVAGVAVAETEVTNPDGSGGAVAAWNGATVNLVGGSFDAAFAAKGGVIAVEGANVIATGITAQSPTGTIGGAFAYANGGSLVVTGVSVTPSDPSRGTINTFGAAVTLTDVAISDAPGGFIDGTVAIFDSPGATLTRMRLCANRADDGGAALTIRGGIATLRSSLVWNSASRVGAVQVHAGPLTVENTTFWNNETAAIEVGATGTLTVTRSLFAGQSADAVAVTLPDLGGTLIADGNWLATGSDAGDLDPLTPSGDVMFQSEVVDDPWLPTLGLPDNTGCEANFWVHWDSPAVDWDPAIDPLKGDVDGTEPDAGRYGGPQGWDPAAIDAWDPDDDGDRADLDCTSADGDQFPRNDLPGFDCRCDTDHDGFVDGSCPERDEAAPFDCDDGRAEVNPAATEIPEDGLDNDCADGDPAAEDPPDTGSAPDTDSPENTDGTPETDAGLIFGGGGCGCDSAPGAGGLAWLVGLAVVAGSRSTRRRAG